jgi:hypothetical protein
VYLPLVLWHAARVNASIDRGAGLYAAVVGAAVALLRFWLMWHKWSGVLLFLLRGLLTLLLGRSHPTCLTLLSLLMLLILLPRELLVLLLGRLLLLCGLLMLLLPLLMLLTLLRSALILALILTLILLVVLCVG